jgi:UDP-2,4-diacetamido-2,4,6-trideoxy-beta-L-altropyranose hydrolase
LVAPSLQKTVLFAPSAGPLIGGGHVMRGLTLAEALAARGARCAFAVNDAGAALIDRFGNGAFAIHRADVQSVLSAERFDVLVLDDYALDAGQERPLRDAVKRLVVIDDLADRPHLADLLIDPGYGRTDADYASLLAADAICLTGSRYALVKPTFAQLRADALARPVAKEPRRLFASFGLSDIDGIAARAIDAMRPVFPDLQIDIALASDAQSVPALKGRAKIDPNLRLHLDATHVADLMAAADLAVGAGGASTWERACLGLPTLAVILADNQRAMIRRMASNDALLAVDLQENGFEARFIEALTRLRSSDLRASLRSASAGLCDGRGAERVAEAILAL